MERTSTIARQGQKGFTLVELAIVMIIIGLLIGGILKGQELINNAQVASGVAQIKGVEAAVSTFRDQYSALPGDIANPQTRLPTCGAAPCNFNGDGDGRIDGIPSAAATSAAANEPYAFWVHLSASDILSAVDNAQEEAVGSAAPEFNMGGAMAVGFSPDGVLAGAQNGVVGHYLSIRPGIGAVDANSRFLSTAQTARVDRKLDDGAPHTGAMRSVGSNAGGAVDCTTAATVAGLYNEDDRGQNCSFYVRVQG